MLKNITLAFLFLFFMATSSFGQCVYTITGYVTSSSQSVNNQMVLIYPVGGAMDTVFTNQNGAFQYSFSSNACDTGMVFILQTAGCGMANTTTVNVPLNQTVDVTLALCGQQQACSTDVQTTVVGDTVHYSWVGGGTNGAIPTAVFWDYGNGNGSNNYPNGGAYVYQNPGTYQLCATVIWSNGCTSTDCEWVTIVNNNTPTDSCHVTISTNVSGNTVYYSWTGANSNNSSVQSVNWHISNGTSIGSSPSGGSYTFNTPGVYTICATVVWAGGCTSMDCDIVTVGALAQTICGCVTYVDDNNNTINAGCGTAYLIEVDSVLNTAIIVDSTNITPNGYCFYGNFTGSYSVLAQPCAALNVSQGVLPTYLGNVLTWQNATAASFGSNNFMANCITLSSGQNSQGPAQIGGTILWGDDKAPGDPVLGVTVLLFDINGNAVAASVTDAEGYYFFDNLPYGTYQIYPEFPGYTTFPIYVTVSPENPSVEADNFYLGFGVFATAGVEESVIHIGGLYPNPAQDVVVLSFTSKGAGIGRLSITDITGKVVQNTSVNMVQGQQNISLGLQGMSAGVYTISLSMQGRQMHVKLIKR